MLAACKHASVGPDGGNAGGFSVNLSVVNGAGKPVQGLQIGVFNRSDVAPLPLAPLQNLDPLNVNAVTVVGFDAPVRSHVQLAAFDLDGAPLPTLMDRNPANPGSYVVQFSPPHSYGTRVYKLRLLASDSAGAIIFRDSVYAVQWNVDYTLGRIGYTSAAGTFQTSDSLLFPNVLTLPPFVLTSSTGPTPLGTFVIPDTVTVVLADTAAAQVSSYACVIRRGSNDIHLVWNHPPENQPSGSSPPVTSNAIRGREGTAAEHPAAGWKLRQNYPNPFN
jgi:hypothetical protein